MTLWVRFRHAGLDGFGTLRNDTFLRHEGNLFGRHVLPTTSRVTGPKAASVCKWVRWY